MLCVIYLKFPSTLLAKKVHTYFESIACGDFQFHWCAVCGWQRRYLPQHPFPLNEMKLFCLLPEIYNTYPQFRFAGACVNLFIWISFCGCLFPVSRTQSYFSTVFGQLCITNFLGSKWRAKCFPLRAFLGSAFQVLKINVTFGPLLSPFPFCSSHIFPGRA